jgi:hypothetical protein
MESVDLLVLSLKGLIWGGMLVLIIYFAIRAYKKRKNDTFENREN